MKELVKKISQNYKEGMAMYSGWAVRPKPTQRKQNTEQLAPEK